MKRLVHELQVHQIELEMQNDELRRTQSELELSRTQYFDLYDLAPVGYFTLSEKGMILGNLTGANLLARADMSELLQQPMTAILGFADILLENSATKETIESAQIIKRNGDHLLKLINDILDLSKIEAGKCTVDLQKCSPSQIASEVISLMKVRADAKGLPLTLEVQGTFPKQSRPIRSGCGKSSSTLSAMPSSSPRSATSGSSCGWTQLPRMTQVDLRRD